MRRFGRCCRLLGAGVLILLQVIPSPSQLTGRARDFVAPSPADAEGNRWVLRGEFFDPLPGGVFQIRGMMIESYRQHRKDLIIRASECHYDRAQQTAQGEGILEVASADGRFSITGRGFRWQHNILIISNAVHMVVRGKLLEGGQPLSPPDPGVDQAGLEEDPVHILGDHFHYDGRQAVFRGEVEATQGESRLACRQLTGQFDPGGNLVYLEALGEVRFEQPQLQAGGDRGRYQLEDDRVSLEGSAIWRSGPRHGSAGTLLIEPRSRRFTAIDQVVVTLPAGQMLALGSGPALETTIDDPQEGVAVITSGHLDYTPQRAAFTEKVEVAVPDGGRLTAGELIVDFDPATGSLVQVAASQSVVFDQAESLITGGTAVYSAQTGWITVPESPRWHIEGNRGSSDLLLIRPEERRFQARGNVRMELSGLDLARADLGFSLEPNPAPSSSSPQHQTILIESGRADYEPELAMFQENVRVRFQKEAGELDGTTAGGEIQARRLSMVWKEDRLSEIFAEGEVRLRHGEVQGACHSAHYAIQDGLIVLTGQAVVTSPTRRIHSEVLYLDRARQMFYTAPGTFRIEAMVERKTPASMLPGTGTFRSPGIE